jgi:hypothetical protein
MRVLVARRTTAGALLAALLLATGCTADPPAEKSEPRPTAPPTASAPPDGPDAGACYRLGFKQAVAPTTTRRPVACDTTHTTETYDVGRLDTLVGGHLLAVDSQRVQAQIRRACPAALSRFVGGTPADLRLSMVRPLWFTPTVEESDQGADWYRCDAVVVAGDQALAPLTASLEGALATPRGRAAFAMCGTAAPDDPDFERVLCSSAHSWRAVSVVAFEPGAYPGEEVVQERGQTPCEDAGATAAEDPLDFQWGYEWPTAEQWEMGQTFGRCWAPD